jgi:hypothetical protein
MSLVTPNLPVINKKDPQLGEALKAVEKFVNLNVVPVEGNKVAPPPTSIADPTKRPG